MAEGDDIAARWADLGEMDRAALRVEWTTVFGDTPPSFLSMPFMRKALIWQSQARAFGGMKPDLKRALTHAAGETSAQNVAAPLSPGTQLVREWNGRRYQVDVVEGGFVMDRRRFGSLSEVARHITGARWSGPRFFGLRDRKAGGA